MNDDGELIPHAHIIDPKTGELQQDKKTMSVQSDSPLLSEIMSTALLVADEAVAEKIIELYPGMRAMKAEYTNEQRTITEWGFCNPGTCSAFRRRKETKPHHSATVGGFYLQRYDRNQLKTFIFRRGAAVKPPE